MAEREFRQNGENQSGRDGRKSYNNREGYVANSVRTVLRSILDLIITTVVTVSNVVDMAIIIMVVRSVITEIVRMEIMKEVNVLIAHQDSIIMEENVSSASLLLDSIMKEGNNVHSVLVRDSRADIVSKVEDMEITVRVDSVSVQTIIIRMLSIA